MVDQPKRDNILLQGEDGQVIAWLDGGQNMDKPENIPLGEPTKINGEWYYRTTHSLWVLRLTDDARPGLSLAEAAKMPVWVFVKWMLGLKEAAELIFERFHFPWQVEAFDGWDRDSGCPEMSRTVYFQNELDPEADSVRGTFMVRKVNDSTQVGNPFHAFSLGELIVAECLRSDYCEAWRIEGNRVLRVIQPRKEKPKSDQ